MKNKELVPSSTFTMLVHAIEENEKLRALIVRAHKAKGRYHSQIAMCDLYDAAGLLNTRPSKDSK